MKRWLIGGLVGACVGVGAYLAVTRKHVPPPVEAPGPAIVSATLTAGRPAPVMLAEVVDVADLGPLLDPPAKTITGVPFDAEPETVPVSTPVGPPAPDRIPPAIDEIPDGMVPSSHPVDASETTTGWYGSHRLPRQLMRTHFELQLQAVGQRFYMSRHAFMLTDHAFAGLWIAGVPNMVLVKLDPLKNKELTREDFGRKIAMVLSTHETKHFRTLILSHAELFMGFGGSIGVFESQ